MWEIGNVAGVIATAFRRSPKVTVVPWAAEGIGTRVKKNSAAIRGIAHRTAPARTLPAIACSGRILRVRYKRADPDTFALEGPNCAGGDRARGTFVPAEGPGGGR